MSESTDSQQLPAVLGRGMKTLYVEKSSTFESKLKHPAYNSSRFSTVKRSFMQQNSETTGRGVKAVETITKTYCQSTRTSAFPTHSQ